MKARARLTIPVPIEAGLNPGGVVIRVFADGLPEKFSEYLPKSGDEATELAHGDKARAEATGVLSLEIISYDGDTGRTRSYTALLRLETGGWHRIAAWRAPELDG